MMEVEGRSSDELSSAPASDAENPFANHTPLSTASNTITVSSHHQAAGAFKPSPSTANRSTDVDKAKVKRPRKKKDPSEPPAEKKPRKVRSDKGLTIAERNERKRLKLEQDAQAAATPPSTLPTSTAAISHQNQPVPFPSANTSVVAPAETVAYAPNGTASTAAARPLVNPMQPARPVTQYSPVPHPQPQTQPPRSKAIFDPVRSLNIVDDEPTPPPKKTSTPTSLNTPPHTNYRPSTSPAIASIINPPDIDMGSGIRPATTVSPIIEHHRPATTEPIPVKTEAPVKMDVDGQAVATEKKPATETAVTTKPAPKPRAKEQPPPLPTGSGLLSSSLFGGDSGMDAKPTSEKGPNIVLHIDLRNAKNKVINFARLAEEKYGFAALYPRQAAQKERLARVAAAGAALERAASGNKGTSAGESGDEDVSVDIDRDSDNDGDIAMTGMNGTGDAVNSGTDGPVPKRRKRKDEYDVDDDFVDDSEMLWETQAAASKDGFFVYCGPLVPEGEKPAVERADGTVKRGRGRGRGGGPGSRGGRGVGTAQAAATAEGASGRGGGPGSRGGGVTRKPRITKAERAQREAEKKQREQVTVLAAKPATAQA